MEITVKYFAFLDSLQLYLKKLETNYLSMIYQYFIISYYFKYLIKFA